MSNTDYDRYRAWTQRPARPIHYGLLARWLDYRRGRRDGRRGVPKIVVEGEQGFVDPVRLEYPAYIMDLAKRAAQQIQREVIRHEAERAPHARTMAELNVHAQTLREQVHSAEERLRAASVPPTEEELKMRRTAEEQGRRSDYVVRSRRIREHQRRRTDVEAELRPLAREHNATAAALAEAREDLASLRKIAAASITRIHEHAWRRVATYWQQLVLNHTDGLALNSLLRPAGPELPAWVRATNEEVEGGTHDEMATPRTARGVCRPRPRPRP